MKKNKEPEHKTKIKLVKLYEILLRRTDYNNALTTGEILSNLSAEGIIIDRRVLSDDIKTMIMAGYDIGRCKIGHSNAYYLKQERWNKADSRMVVDAIQAARFITKEQTDRLIKNVKKSFCSAIDIQPAELVRFNARKSHNNEVMNNIIILEEALRDERRVSFEYFDIDENHCRKYRKNRERYIVEPIALIYQDDFYYLMTWNSKHSDVTNYRIDRIACIKEEENTISEIAKNIACEQKVVTFTKEAFNMFGGIKKKYIIEFEDTLLGPIYDKFGEDLPVKRNEKNLCEAEIEVRESPTWEGWLAQFGEKAKIKKT